MYVEDFTVDVIARRIYMSRDQSIVWVKEDNQTFGLPIPTTHRNSKDTITGYLKELMVKGLEILDASYN